MKKAILVFMVVFGACQLKGALQGDVHNRNLTCRSFVDELDSSWIERDGKLSSKEFLALKLSALKIECFPRRTSILRSCVEQEVKHFSFYDMTSIKEEENENED